MYIEKTTILSLFKIYDRDLLGKKIRLLNQDIVPGDLKIICMKSTHNEFSSVDVENEGGEIIESINTWVYAELVYEEGDYIKNELTEQLEIKCRKVKTGSL